MRVRRTHIRYRRRLLVALLVFTCGTGAVVAQSEWLFPFGPPQPPPEPPARAHAAPLRLLSREAAHQGILSRAQRLQETAMAPVERERQLRDVQIPDLPNEAAQALGEMPEAVVTLRELTR